MSLIVKIITGYICTCGRRFEGDDAGIKFIEHLSNNPSHQLDHVIYTNVPSVGFLIGIVLFAVLISALISFFIADKCLTSYKDGIRRKEISDRNRTSIPRTPAVSYSKSTNQSGARKTTTSTSHNTSTVVAYASNNNSDYIANVVYMAKMNIYGIDMERNVEKGIEYLEKAGDNPKLDKLWFDAGVFLLEEKSLDRAIYCFEKTAKHGYPEAVDKLNDLKSEGDLKN